MSHHPVESGNYLIPTPQIQELTETIQWWLENRITGAVVYGKPRVGKTSAMKLISELLLKSVYNIPCYYMSAVRETKPSESSFYTQLLQAVQHPKPTNRNKASKRVQLLDFLILAARDSEQDRLVITIDEAQNLTEYHYDWLIGLYNELYHRDIQLITFLVGQEQLNLQKQSFREMGMNQIVGRFMVDSIHFYGIRTKKEIEAVLTAFDSKIEYPEGSGVSYTNYYFKSGLQLANYSENLYIALKNINLNYSLRKDYEIPLYSFIPIIREMLLQCGDYGKKLTKIETSDWEEIIKSTMYITWMRIT
ncbi:ATP-binding protein [Streptococcus constellatus]|uniref:ATP-binding protein n=1 Tax=Streptococcus constellatus TaxID=76860 RepID=UPI001C5A2A9A|nr:ATP-binding protein [Streptococcus constellatus]MBW3453268.1 ATP-binding protein [Streptococcus constellatus]